MQCSHRVLLTLVLLTATLLLTQFDTFAASSPTPPSANEQYSLAAWRIPTPIDGLGSAIARALGRSKAWGLDVVLQIGCKIAENATEPFDIYQLLILTRPISSITYQDAMTISQAIATYQREHPLLYQAAVIFLKAGCSIL